MGLTSWKHSPEGKILKQDKKYISDFDKIIDECKLKK